MKTSKIYGVPLPQEYYAGLGECLVEWSWLEYRLQEIIWHLRGGPRKTARAATTSDDIWRWLKSLKPLLAVMGNTDAKRTVEGLLAQVENMVAERNRLVHGVWAMDGPVAKVRRYRDEHRIGNPVPYSAEGLAKFAADVRMLKNVCNRPWTQYRDQPADLTHLGQ